MVPPSISGTPKRRQKTPKTAFSAATRRSHHSASSRPPATACPSTAAMTGLPTSIRDRPSGASPSTSRRGPRGSSGDIEVRSAPAQNVSRAPVRMATFNESSTANSRNAPARADAVGPSTALRTSGLSMTTVITPAVRNVRTVGVDMRGSSQAAGDARIDLTPVATAASPRMRGSASYVPAAPRSPRDPAAFPQTPS